MEKDQHLLHLRLDPYLAQWFINEQGGEPVRLDRASIESKILEQYLMTLPPNCEPQLPQEDTVAIIIPTFRVKDPAYYNYLPKTARDALVQCIRDRFDVELFTDLHTFARIGMRLDNIIYAWMETHGIELTETNWCVISKRYQRQRRVYTDRMRKRGSKKSKK